MLSGLPRSGSQLLSSMLNQHPAIYSTTTSPVADLVSIVGDNWPHLSQALIDPSPAQYGNIVRGVIQGAYEHIEKSVIVDKNRLWPRFINITKYAVGTPKIICTVRNMPDIMASYILLINRNQGKTTFIDQAVIDAGMIVNDKNRCKLLLETFINHPYTSLRMGYNNPDADLLFVEYNDIVETGQNTVDRVCDFMGIDRYKLNSDNLQPMDESDHVHGGMDGQHEVRPQLTKTSPPPEKVLGKELTKLYTDMRLEFWRK